MTTPAGALAWGQLAKYNAVEDRSVITALSRGQTGLARAPALTPGSGGVVNVGPWLALVDAGDGTIAVASARVATAITIPGGPPSGSRVDVLWTDLDVNAGTWALTLRSVPDTAGRLGISLGQVTVPAGVSAASGMTLAPREDDYDAFWNMPVRSFANAAERAALWPAPRTGCLSYLIDIQTLSLFRFGAWRAMPTSGSRADAFTGIGTFDPYAAVAETVGHVEPVTNSGGGFYLQHSGTGGFLGFNPRCVVGAAGSPSLRVAGQPSIVADWQMYASDLTRTGFNARNLANGAVITSTNAPMLIRIAYQR